ncbi:MAG: NTP transferase domain-containing protein [Methylococcales bacterium]
MHIVIPMSGIGKRFIDAGYTAPKPLIEIDGKPIIQHVVELFPGESKFTFICNQVHLETTNMKEVLQKIAPQGNVVSIEPHKLGPVYAVSQISDLIDDDEEVIVNYCDFGTYWDYADFLQHTRNRNADGAIPSYKGFHPHMLGSTNYAFMRDDKQWMLEIKEKEPFTDNRMEEYASNGTYYFSKGKFIKKYFKELMQRDINLNGEFYVSLVYNLLIEDGLNVSIYNIQHMLQWGTPGDVAEYQAWSEYFEQVMNKQNEWPVEQKSVNLIPLAGKGSRFKNEGYQDPKPLLPVSGKYMILQANSQLPKSEINAYVCLKEHCDEYAIDKALKDNDPDAIVEIIDQVTEGQAITCELGLKHIDDNSPLLIGACDNGALWNHKKYKALIEDESIDAIIWTFKGHPSAIAKPTMYGWVKTENNIATGVSVKVPVSDTPENDHAVVGTFYFRTASLYKTALEELVNNNIRVNNEFYVDSLMDVLIQQGKKVVVFQVDSYTCWGTPDDYETFNYWQSFFHKNIDHKYNIKLDPYADKNKIDSLVNCFTNFKQEFL